MNSVWRTPLKGGTAARLPALLADCTLVAVEGGPYDVAWTHSEEVNPALLSDQGVPRARRTGSSASVVATASARCRTCYDRKE
jgi:hypothetical protein